MKALIQRVSEASVEVDGQRVAEIGQGLLVLLGITHSDGMDDVAWLGRKIPALRIFEDEAGLMNRSVQDIGGSVLVVSQFTLYADTHKGNRPSFVAAARPEHAEPLYEALVRHLRDALGASRVGTGVFGAEMKVRLLNDGPVTVELITNSE
ncbi:MAG: D-aminoacyl-tRNA deacylase [Kiritimatiellae bacterium]|jgi:D-tyrosyl-tRNA(Tyr) deacylase|nr:D-aminoacyl-tRNA deacylase [Kiritimatiellia bacterium]MDD3583008.1 D-aminoacyl-tRNA deacylase [Kiritimatiellia bacterium]